MEIIIIRKKQFVDKYRNYNVIINNKIVDEIKPNENKSLVLNAGDQLKIGLDWCTSNHVIIEKNMSNLIVYNPIPDTYVYTGLICALTCFFIGFAGKNYLLMILPTIFMLYPLFKLTRGKGSYLKVKKLA